MDADGRAQVQANRTWSIPLAITRAAGTHSLMVQQECEGYRSGWSAAHEGPDVHLARGRPLGEGAAEWNGLG